MTTPHHSLIHPARAIPYRELLSGLREAHAKKLVTQRRNGPHSLWCYTPSCVYERAWDDITVTARGLILDEERECVAATPFVKFFNLGERGESFPTLPFETFEKLDGSLIIIWNDGDTWRTATKGSFDSVQAQAAAAWMSARDLSPLIPSFTYLAEYVAPTNRIVVPYEREELVLLAAYDGDGYEHAYPLIEITAGKLGWRVAERHSFDSINVLVDHVGTLPATSEGFVLRFTNGVRLKVKGEEYRRIHALISRCTPLALWAVMMAGDGMVTIREQLPDEFLTDFDAIWRILSERINRIVVAVEQEAHRVASLSDKEVGLRLHEWPEPIRQFIFPYRKNGGDLLTGRARQALFQAIRPTGNVLDGYTPSYAMNRVMEESL